jgi:hypothetical protein
MSTIEIALCSGGILRNGGPADGFPCTGSGHLSNGQEVRCTDPSHTVAQPDLTGITLAPNLTIGSAVTGDVAGQKLTCS